MYILGVLSVIQILFLPGLILMKFFHGVKGFIQKLIYTFGLSLIFNHLFVVLLTHLKINQPVFHYILFCAEFIIVIYLYWSDLKEPIVSRMINLYQEFANNLSDLFKPASDKITIQSVLKNIIVIIFLGWSVYSILWTISLFLTNLGSVFTIWDSVVSWNRWAVEWFSNSHPFDTKRYAQLIPTNFSITYSFMRSDKIQSFAIGIMPLFAVYFLLLMFDLGIKKKEYGYLIGLVVSQYLLKRFYLPLISSGYVDVALMFFTFLAVYTLLIATTQTNEKHLRSTAFLGFIFAAGTALTKQNGLWILAVYPVLAYFIIFSRIESLNKKEKFILLAKYMGVALVLLLPWYIFNELRIASGAKTNVLMLMSQEHHSGLTRVERFNKSVQRFEHLCIFISISFVFVAIYQKR